MEIPILGVRAVATMLHLHPNTVKRIPREDLPYTRIVARGDRRYTVADVHRYLEERRVAAWTR